MADTWAWLLVFVLCLAWNAVCLPFLACGFSLHSCVQSQHGGRRRAVYALRLRAFSSTSKVCLVRSLCHSWPHLVACRHARRRSLDCLQTTFEVQTSACLWKQMGLVLIKLPKKLNPW